MLRDREHRRFPEQKKFRAILTGFGQGVRGFYCLPSHGRKCAETAGFVQGKYIISAKRPALLRGPRQFPHSPGNTVSNMETINRGRKPLICSGLPVHSPRPPRSCRFSAKIPFFEGELVVIYPCPTGGRCPRPRGRPHTTTENTWVRGVRRPQVVGVCCCHGELGGSPWQITTRSGVGPLS